MIKNIIKRDGRIEPYSPDKINDWGQWMASQLGPNAPWIKVTHKAIERAISEAECGDGNVPSTVLNDLLIDECLRLKTYTGYMMAGKLYAAQLPKDIYGTKTYPKLVDLHRRMIEDGVIRDMGYTQAEYDVLETVIDHEVDLRTIHYSLEYIRKKYAVQNRPKKIEYETPQFVLMRMAMALAEDEPQATRLDLVKAFYRLFKEKLLSAPSPNYTNLGTHSTTYASCCLYTIGDSIPALTAGNVIAHEMTAAGAGLGMNLRTRSINDPVRGGTIVHSGKYPYYRAQAALATANKQGSRSGALNGQYSIFDPEVDLLIYLRNPSTPVARRNRDMHFAWFDNPFVAKKAALNEDIFLFNDYTAPDLMAKFYSSDLEGFERLYAQYEADPNFVKQYRNARDLVINAFAEGAHTGTYYYGNIYEINRHTPFKEPIDSSNLCVAGETLLTTDRGEIRMDQNVGKVVNVWNGQTYSQTMIKQTSESEDLWLVRTDGPRQLKCTGYHKWYVMQDGKEIELRTHQLKAGMEVSPFNVPGVQRTMRLTVVEVRELGISEPVYCVNEPLRHRAMFNGLLTGQCMEITQPKFPYPHTRYLYDDSDHGQGEISTCNLGAINVSMLDLTPENDEIYEELAYLSLKMIDRTIHLSKFPFEHLNFTSRQRMNAAVGIMGLATLMARNGKHYDDQAGRDFVHQVMERHMYFLIRASLRLGRELGNAPWINRTKWPEGWLPIDTYKRHVDELVSVGYQYDWENLRKDIIANGGIRNSSLCALMPGESSSKGLGASNSYYPIRHPVLAKTDGMTTIRWAAYKGDDPSLVYDAAYRISMLDMVKFTAVMQKFVDQAISMDLFRDLTEKGVKIPSTEILEVYFAMHRYGIKTRYYFNVETSADNDAENARTVRQIMLQDEAVFDDIDLSGLDSECEGCSV